MSAKFFAAALPVALVGCQPQNVDQTVFLKGVKYRISSTYIYSLLAEAEAPDNVVVGIKLPGEQFDLRYSYRHYLPNAQGANIPTIHWVNDGPGKAYVLNERGTTVMCKVADPVFAKTCGVQVIDAELRWAAVFDEQLVARAPEIKAAATAYLARFRQSAKKHR